MWVYLPWENFATQWPAPDGFHVPLSSEWVSLKWICTTLWFTLKWGTAKSYLKMPYTGYRRDTSTVSSQWSNGRYWTSSWIWRNAYYVNISNSSFTPNLGSGRCYGSAIRCFKNVELVPNASWTTLYDWSGVATWAWIFHNSSLWLISLSWDGSTWITIMDKNLWATTVYNDWDTLSEANCWKYYQWGNNYWFPRTWNVTTSSTQVDASNYWPWNYYNSSTFITISSSPYDRSSIQNNNLWWWEDGNVPTMSELKNAYIGEYVNYRTFTISRTEWSNMSSWWTYSDDAAWLTAGSWDFDDFFWYSAVLLNTSGVETAEMKQSWWVFTGAMTTLGNITSWDNVMIKFPVRWIKMSKSWSVVTLSITEDPNKDGYQYYAHCTWTLSNPWTPKDAFYLWAYKISNNGSNVLKSWSWKSPEVSQTQATFCSRAGANGSGYNIIWYYQKMYINALYMMKYWNPDSKEIVWYWYSAAGNSSTNTWWTNGQTDATYGTTANWTTQCKLFWLEDWWGNRSEWIWWVYTDWNNNLCTQLSWYSWTLSWWENTWSVLWAIANYLLSGIAWTNKGMFWPIAVVSEGYGYYNTYYCSYVRNKKSSLLCCWWHSNSARMWGALVMAMEWYTETTKSDYITSRLLYL